MNRIVQVQSRPTNSKILLDLGSCQTHEPMDSIESQILSDLYTRVMMDLCSLRPMNKVILLAPKPLLDSLK